MNVIRLKLQNYLSFRDEEVDFSSRDGLYLVIGKNDGSVDESDGNGAGKTSFISAVRFSLSGKIRGEFSKDLNIDDVIYKDENDETAKSCNVEMDCEIGDICYRIVRTASKSGQTLDLYVAAEDGQWTCLTLKAGISRKTGKRESGIVRTQDRIFTIFGFDDELFCNSAFFEQSNIDTFSRGTLTEKDNILKSAIGLSKWDEYASIMKDDMAILTTAETATSALLDDIGSKEDLEGALDVAMQMATNSAELVDKTKKDLDAQEGKYIVFVKRMAKVKADYDKLVDMMKEDDELKVSLECDLKDNLRELRTLEGYVSFSESKLEKLQREIKIKREVGVGLKGDIDEINLPKKTKSELQLIEQKFIDKQILIASEVSELKSKLESLSSSECPLGLTCTILGKNATNLIDNLTEKLNDASSRLLAVKTKREYVGDMLQAIASHTQLTSQLDVVREQFKSLKLDYTSTKERLNELSVSIDKIKSAIESTRTNIEKISNRCDGKINKMKKMVDAYDAEDTIIRDSIEANKQILVSLEGDLQNTKHECTQIRSKLAKRIELGKKFNDIQKQKVVIKKAMFAVGKDIPHLLISQAVPEIQRYVSDFVYELSGGRLDVQFKMTKELKSKVDGQAQTTNAFDPWVCVDGRWLKYQQVSGGERARVDVAIHLSWVCFKATRSNTRIETLFLDEVGSALDKSGMEKLVELLRGICERFGCKKVFFITQNPDAKKLIDNRIQITKTTKGSVVEFI